MTTTTHAIGIDSRIEDSLRQQLGPQKFAMWFDGSARFAYRAAEQTLTVTVPTQFARNWIARHFSSDLRDAAKSIAGAVVELDVQVDAVNAEQPPALPATPMDAHTYVPSAGLGEAGHGVARFAEPARRPRPVERYKHKLNQFVTGPSNRMAYAAAQRAADLADPTANHPLFLHGSCGVGKTHLLQGICAQAKAQRPDAKVLYLTAEQFTNDFIAAVRSNKLEAFRRRMRRLDLLAIDDVHFLACKEKTQTEFLCCFEENDLAGARIILASDTHPKQIRSFSDALVSRCVCGLVVGMDEPDAATRQAVLTELARRRGMLLQPAVAQMLGERYEGSVRDLEGLLAQLHALASLPEPNRRRGPADMLVIGRELVEQLPAFTEPVVRKPVRFKTIVEVVCERLAVEPSQLAGSSRHKFLVLARSLAVYLAREMTTMSYPEIAHAMGRKNHSTVITADQRMRRQLKADEPIMLPASAGSVTPSELAASLTRETMRSQA